METHCYILVQWITKTSFYGIGSFNTYWNKNILLNHFSFGAQNLGNVRLKP